MTGEMHEFCMLVNAAGNALRTSSRFHYEKTDYIDHTEFKFLPEKKLSRRENPIVHSADDWFTHCKSRGLEDIKLLCPVKVQNRTILGYINTAGASAVTFYPASRVTFWTSHWEFVPERKKWIISYTENPWDNPPKEKLRFEDNTEQFNRILNEISDFADEISFSGFGNIFRSAMHILNGTEDIPDRYPNGRKIILPQLTDAKKRLFYAASKADVFGAMGSWNDSPPWYAKEKGLGDKYDRLSDELLKQIHLAILYSINET